MTANPADVVMVFIAAINRRDAQEIAGLMTEDHVFVDPSGRLESGRQKMTEGWKHYFCLFPDYAIQVETVLVQGDLVAVFGSVSGTYNGKRGLGRENRIEMPAAWRAEVQNDRVKRWQVYADWTAARRAMAEDEATG